MSRLSWLAAAASGLAAVAIGVAPAQAAPAAHTARAVPAGTAAPANPYQYSIYGRSCRTAEAFTAKQVEYGVSGTQQFVQTVQVQKYTTAGWRNEGAKYVFRSNRFPNNATSYQWVQRYTHQYNAGERGATVRMLWQGFWLNGAGRAIAHSPLVQANSCNVY